MKLRFVTAAILACPPATIQAQACGVTPSTVITDSGVGALTIGSTVAQVKQRCRVVSDSVRPNYDSVEDERALSVLVGTDTVIAWVPRDSVYGIDIASTFFRTRDSLGVGTTLKALLERRGVTAVTGEASTWANLPEHCALNFILSYDGTGEDGQDYSATDLAAWPPNVFVTMIRIGPCYGPGS